jgi:hypothetical protein
MTPKTVCASVLSSVVLLFAMNPSIGLGGGLGGQDPFWCVWHVSRNTGDVGIEVYFNPIRRHPRTRGISGMTQLGLIPYHPGVFIPTDIGNHVVEDRSCDPLGSRSVRVAFMMQTDAGKAKRNSKWLYLAHNSNDGLLPGGPDLPTQITRQPSRHIVDGYDRVGSPLLKLRRPYICLPGRRKRQWWLRWEVRGKYGARSIKYAYNTYADLSHRNGPLVMFNGLDAARRGANILESKRFPSFPYC